MAGLGGPQWGGDYSAPMAGGGNNGKAIASMILGIAGIFTCGLASIVAVILGHISRGEIKRSGGREQGSGMALAGLILGYIMLALLAGFIIIAIVAAITSDTNSNTFNR